MTQSNTSKVACICYTCGETFYRYQSKHIGPRTFCSRECQRNSAPKRFWEYVEKTDTCWLWSGGCDNLGYGNFRAYGTQVKAHQFAYELLVGPIPEGHELDHVAALGCTHRNCVNPDHLEPVTHLENMRRGKRANAPLCSNGHPRTPDNIYVYKSGRKVCRICRNAYQNRKRRQQRIHRVGLT